MVILIIRRQFDQGRALSEKQFAILARTTLENLGEGEAAAPLRARLSALSPEDGAQPTAADPALPGLLAMLEEIGTWREPTKRGKRVFDDREFADSLKGQFARRKTPTPRQVAALRKMLVSYREQIPNFDERAKTLGFTATSGGAKRRTGGRSRR